MSAYEELVERCGRAIMVRELRPHTAWSVIDDKWREPARAEKYKLLARDVLAEVLRTLSTVTPEVPEPSTEAIDMGDLWLAMLRASPLTPPKL